MAKQTAIYVRVSTAQQSTRSQLADLNRWVAAQDPQAWGSLVFYEDKATGKNMNRPGWQKLQAAIDARRVDRLVVWRLDRLGRTASGLCKLFDDLQASTCYSSGDPGWFTRSLPSATTQPVEVRILVDQGSNNENVLLTRLELYVR